MKPLVVKVGGAALAHSAWLADFAAHAVRARSPLVIVHGGGPDINALAERLGLGFTWVDGRRVTSPELMDVVSMVLNGRIGKRIVSALVSAGGDAVGLSGEDGALIRAQYAAGGALGRVGEVEQVRAELLEWLVARGIIPVLSSVSRGPDGRALNVNADEIAGAVAVALGASELLFLTDVAGVLAGGVVRSELSVAEARGLIEAKQATGGMALKLGAAMRALEMGVGVVRIGRFETLQDSGAGTRVRQETEVLTWR